jgi:ATP-dependent Clp protease, protease subunit
MKILNAFDNNSEEWTENYLKKIKSIGNEKLEYSIKNIDFVNRNIFLDTITPTIAKEIDQIIRFWNLVDEKDIMKTELSSRKPIKIYISSFGGSLSAALTLVDTIRLSKTPVYTINAGTVYKESIYVYLAGRKKYSYPRASFYWEKDMSSINVFSDVQCNYEDFLESQKLELKDLLMDGTKITDNDYEKRKGWWMTADKAYELHICNEVLRSNHLL